MALTKIGATLGGSADVITVTQSSHGLRLGRPVKMTSSGYAHATADTAANAEAIGIVIASDWDGSSGANTTFTLALSGRITVDGCVPNLAAGTVLFLQVASGLLAAAEPDGNNQVSKPMAVITVANSEMIMVQQRGEVISTAGISLADDSVTNAKLANMAANTVKVRDANSSGDPSDKAVADTQLLIGDGTGFTAAALSGDVTMANDGAVTIANNAVENAMMADDSIGVAELNTTSGTASSSTFLRGDMQWQAAGATDISCRVYSSAAQTADNNVDQVITFNQESYDTDNMHDNSTNNSRIKATTAGKYMIVVNVEWAANGTGWRNHYLRHSSGDTIASTRLNTVAAPSKCVVSFTGVWNFAANEYVELKVAQNSGSTRTINNGEGVTTIAMHKIN